ncbi:MAG: outer membrane lipoprotein LolB [Gammaproteobacteria bacterium RIFCSPHIGHO2_12_FULL_38_11]|nr:MAG: outer membrane lipoprotein LolB [Gammaproteobacteria bacterium RIFCSPHIGHO2_12_FULL_38_11]
MIKKCLLICGVVLLSGCVRLQTPVASKTFEVQNIFSRQVKLSKINNWKIHGAFSIAQTGQQPEIANYVWNQVNSENYRIEISSALNLYSVVIVCRSGLVSLLKNGSQRFSAKTPEKLMEKALGWSLPISELDNWIKGMPADGKYKAKYDVYGHLILLKQMGWTVQYGSYKANKNVDLPQMITLQRTGLFVKIVTNQFDRA